MSKEYKRLNLNRDKIVEVLEEFLSQRYASYTIDKNVKDLENVRKRIKFSVEGTEMYLDVHYNSDGTTTLEDFGGSNSTIKPELCQFIKERCEISSSDGDSWFVVDKISEEDFQIIVDMVLESQYCAGCISKNEKENLYHFKGIYGEKLTITFHNQKNNKLVIQGKQLLLFMFVREIVTELVDYDDIPKLLNTNYQNNIDKDGIVEQTRIYMKNSYDRIWSEKLKKCILQAVYDLNRDEDMFDYTELVFSAYRALEGHMRNVIREAGITIDKNFYIFDQGTTHMMSKYKNDVRAKISDLNKANAIIEYIENTYKYFGDKRHIYFHWLNPDPTGRDITPIVRTTNEARGMIKETLEYIDKYFEKF